MSRMESAVIHRPVWQICWEVGNSDTGLTFDATPLSLLVLLLLRRCRCRRSVCISSGPLFVPRCERVSTMVTVVVDGTVTFAAVVVVDGMVMIELAANGMALVVVAVLSL